MRKKRIQVGDEDSYIDLLFYNRRLKQLKAIDLKLGAFKAHYKGQMEPHLRWLGKHERQVGEEPPLGIILCAENRQEQVELLQLNAIGIHVAEYNSITRTTTATRAFAACDRRSPKEICGSHPE